MFALKNNNGHYYQGTRNQQSVWIHHYDKAVLMPTKARARNLQRWLKKHRNDRAKIVEISDPERLSAGALEEVAVLNAKGRRSAIRIIKRQTRQDIKRRIKGKNRNDKTIKTKYRNIKRPT